MKHIMIALIKIYKNIPGRFHDRCKYYPTCSTYSLISYERFGFIKRIDANLGYGMILMK